MSNHAWDELPAVLDRCTCANPGPDGECICEYCAMKYTEYLRAQPALGK